MNIEILDLGINNIQSVVNSLQASVNFEIHIEIMKEAKSVSSSSLLILPGLGHFQAGMENLRARGFEGMIQKHVEEGGKLAGICLGMQLLFEVSEEAPGCDGLGLIEGRVAKLPPIERVPNIGWNSTKLIGRQSAFQSLDSEGDFYFVHSYYCIPKKPENVLACTAFGNQQIVSGVIKQNIIGIQFHPEKSGRSGKSFLGEMIAWARA